MKDETTDHQAILSRLTDHFDLIHDLHDALDVGDDLLRHLLMEIRAEVTLKHKHAAVGFTSDAS